MLEFLVYQVVIPIIIFGLLWYIISLFTLPAPLGQIVRVVFIVVVVIWLIYLLMGFVGSGVPRLR